MNTDREEQKKVAERILRSYAPKEENGADALRRLDKKVRLPATLFGWLFGCLAALVLGVGMCLAMEVIGSMMPLGIVIGIVGIVMVAANYFIYRAILNSRKKKYADRVISLSDELLHSEQA